MYRGFLLGVNGYACRSFILTPLLAPHTDKERRFNASYIRTRNLIERAFSILKRGFAVLSVPVHTKLTNTKNIIIACAVLHNIVIMNRLLLDDQEDVGVLASEIPENKVDDHQGGQHRRAIVIDRFF